MYLYLDNKRVRVKAIREAVEDQEIPFFLDFGTYFREVLSFCRSWLHGQQEFTIHTSGSTGVPKAIKITRSQIEASARMTVRALGLTASDTALVCLNTAYIAGKMMLVRGLEAGMDMVIIHPYGRPFAQVPENISIDFTAMVPLQVQNTLNAGSREERMRIDRLKALLVGGAPVSYDLHQAIREHINAPVYSTYGMTETVSHIALKRLNGQGQDEAYKVLDDIDIDTDQRGCLTIRGAVTGFQKLTTNDIVQIKDERHFEWLGRADYVINSGGVKILPEKVEAVVEKWMSEKKKQERFFVGALPDQRLGERAVLIMECSALPPELEQDLLNFLRLQLSSYEVPKEVYYIQDFMMTETGKVQRRQTLKFIR